MKQRVLIPGMGGQLGTNVARWLEQHSDVAICGLDLEPPRRWMRRAEFHFVRPTDAERIAEVVDEFQPTALAFLWTFEPHSRATPTAAEEQTAVGWRNVADALAESADLDTIVVRSGLEVYGGRGGTTYSTTSPITPTCRFGRMLAAVESGAGELAEATGASVAALRLGPISGANMPSPLGRYLRLPVVPIPLRQKPFTVIHQFDAAAAIARAVEVRYDGVLNVVADGTITPGRAVLTGGRFPLPTVGPFLSVTRLVTELLGGPLPDHTRELLQNGRVAEASDLSAELGLDLAYDAAAVIRDLYSWGSVQPVAAADTEESSAV